jgi:hypothetical protein
MYKIFQTHSQMCMNSIQLIHIFFWILPNLFTDVYEFYPTYSHISPNSTQLIHRYLWILPNLFTDVSELLRLRGPTSQDQLRKWEWLQAGPGESLERYFRPRKNRNFRFRSLHCPWLFARMLTRGFQVNPLCQKHRNLITRRILHYNPRGEISPNLVTLALEHF